MIIINCGNMWKHCSVSLSVLILKKQSRIATGVRWRQDSEPVAVAPTKPESGEEETSLWLAAMVSSCAVEMGEIQFPRIGL